MAAPESLLQKRSIPVCTGSPCASRPRRHTCRVYPRVYGVTAMGAWTRCRCWGLSPCVRGHLLRTSEARLGLRSIPVCTGSPISDSTIPSSSTVYPRVYGVTHVQLALRSRVGGLSPCVRGHRTLPASGTTILRSIPVCTGSPTELAELNSKTQVYPRVYGVTRLLSLSPRQAQGLSPCVRGHPSRKEQSGARTGSIPVCTGSPGCSPARRPPPPVYPRVYGVTRPGCQKSSMLLGLSPCVRGHHARNGEYNVTVRSIPVCTGSPSGQTVVEVEQKVYPRVYGVTR